ncbi:MAG: YciI family protein [Myxococcota bacterium]
MHYTFLLYTDPADRAAMTPEDGARQQKAYQAYIGALKEAGVFVDMDWLTGAETATTITRKTGERRVQDGPFAETKETLGGYFRVKVENLDEALAWAEKCPAAETGLVEVRASAFG